MGHMTGGELKELRESRGITLERAAADTCLRAGFLRELEEAADYGAIPEVYQKLSFLMYARYLGVETETTRRAAPAKSQRTIRRCLVPMTNFIRRMDRPPKPPRLDRGQRNHLLVVAKTTSVLVVVVLAIGLYSLNAKLARINIDEKTEVYAAQRAAVEAPRPQLTINCLTESAPPSLSLDEEYALVLLPTQEEAPPVGDTGE